MPTFKTLIHVMLRLICESDYIDADLECLFRRVHREYTYLLVEKGADLDDFFDGIEERVAKMLPDQTAVEYVDLESAFFTVLKQIDTELTPRLEKGE